MRNVKLAAAVASVLASAATSSSFAAGTTAATADAATHKFYIAGASAAVSGFGAAVGTDLCVGGISGVTAFQTVFTGGPAGVGDFRAFSCVAAAGKPNAGDQITIYYRAEAGSVVGAYGPINDLSVNQLDLSAATCAAPFQIADTSYVSNCTGIVGTSAAQGASDGFSGGVSKKEIEFGVTDVEPGALGNSNGENWAGNGNNDPATAPAYTFLGADHTPDDLQSFSHSLLFQEVFGLVANKALNITDLSTDAAAAILNGTLTNWTQVSKADGTVVKTASTPIHVCHRDLGSGTRTISDIFFTGDGCLTTGVVPLKVKASDPAVSWATADVLTCVDADAASVGYVSIDNFSKVLSNTTSLTLDGRTATNKLAATGGYQYVSEASGAKNPTAIAKNPDGAAFYAYLIPALQAVNTAPQAAHVNALAGVNGNHSGGGALVASTSGKIFVSNFDRDTTGAGNSCRPLTKR